MCCSPLYVGSTPFVPWGFTGLIRVTSGFNPVIIQMAIASVKTNDGALDRTVGQMYEDYNTDMAGAANVVWLRDKLYGRRTMEVVSFCGHPQTAEYLGVEASRGEAILQVGQLWVGIRPKKRPTPGQELEVNSDNFEGFVMEVLSAD